MKTKIRSIFYASVTLLTFSGISCVNSDLPAQAQDRISIRYAINIPRRSTFVFRRFRLFASLPIRKVRKSNNLGTFMKISQHNMIQNETLRAFYDESTGTFQLAHVSTGRPFAVGGALVGIRGSARTETVKDDVFGSGRAIIVTGARGGAARIMLFPHLPFALVRLTLQNSGDHPEVLNQVPVATLRVAGLPPPATLKVLGTGGLSAPHDNLGSYAWLTVADPATRGGVVAGWLTGERGSGVLFSKVEGDAVTLTARGDYGRLLLAPGASAETETLAVGGFDDARLGLEAWADAVARKLHIHHPPQPAGFCTWYSEKHSGSSDEKNMAVLTDFAAKSLKPYGLDFLQIDDGWQRGDSKGNGPNKNFTDYRPDGPYPSGMKAMADDIKAHGLTPGLWFMPFAGTFNDPWFADKQSLFVKGPGGVPYDTSWGGTCLDMTNPAARAYLRSFVHNIATTWGYTYFKMDGLYTGVAVNQAYVNYAYKDDNLGVTTLADPDKTNIEAYRAGLRLVREAAGPRTFLLGCCTPQNMRSYQGAFGLVDAMRIGADNGGTWNSWLGTSPVAGSRNYFLNGRIWFNDPDPFYVRPALSLEEARTTASWSAVTGGLHSNGDWLPDLPAERLDIIRRTMPAHGNKARPVDLFENDPPRIWTVTGELGKSRRDIVGLFNWSDAATEIGVTAKRCGLASARSYVGFDYWANAFVGPFQNTLTANIPAHGCKIIAVHPLLDRPFLLSTSRNVVQGMTDVISEAWSKGTLSGASHVVGGDAYELRVYAPTTPHAWRAVSAAVDGASAAKVTYTQNGNEVRILIICPTSRIVRWSLTLL
jgi:hypothetical protein